MRARFAEAAQVWLVGDRVSASGWGRPIACPKYEGEVAFQVFARQTDDEGVVDVALETGPTDDGPWTEIASLSAEGDIGNRAGVSADRLDAFVRAAYTIEDGTFDLACALIGDAKYPNEAAATGAEDIGGHGVDVRHDSVLFNDTPAGETLVTDGYAFDVDEAASGNARLTFVTAGYSGIGAAVFEVLPSSDGGETYDEAVYAHTFPSGTNVGPGSTVASIDAALIAGKRLLARVTRVNAADSVYLWAELDFSVTPFTDGGDSGGGGGGGVRP